MILEKQSALELVKDCLTKLYNNLCLPNDEFIKMENKKYEKDNIKFEEDEADAIKTAAAKGTIKTLLFVLEN